MKKLISVIALLVAGMTAAHAQLGIIGGFTSSNTAINQDDVMANLKNVSLYHAGVSYKIESGSILVLEPTLVYQMKGAELTESNSETFFESLNTKTGFVELSLGLQAGLDLLAFRPYFVLEPFVGYAVTGSENLDNVDSEALNRVKNKLEYGFGIGGGIELLDHLQVSVQWFKNLGNLYDGEKIKAEEALAAVGDSFKGVQNYSGIKVSLAIFF